MAALTGPVALHRMVTGLELKSETVAWASRLVAAALVLLLAMTSLVSWSYCGRSPARPRPSC